MHVQCMTNLLRPFILDLCQKYNNFPSQKRFVTCNKVWERRLPRRRWLKVCTLHWFTIFGHILFWWSCFAKKKKKIILLLLLSKNTFIYIGKDTHRQFVCKILNYTDTDMTQPPAITQTLRKCIQCDSYVSLSHFSLWDLFLCVYVDSVT